jgi:DNA-binding response OmpR family regulator
MKILIADDDIELREILNFALCQAGYLVVQAADGAEALERFGEEHPDLVILDVNMPRMNGFEVCRRIRAETTTPCVSS